MRELCILLWCLSAGLVIAALGQTTIPSIDVSPSQDLYQMVGVNIHIRYYDTAYWRGALAPSETEDLISLLLDVGVKRVRDGVPVNLAPELIDEWKTLRDAGVRVWWIIDGDTMQIAPVLSLLKLGDLQNITAGFEGQNEPDLNADIEQAYNCQVAWYDAIRADPYFNSNPIIAPSITKPLPIANYFNMDTYPRSVETSDASNPHVYISGQGPENLSAYFSPWTSALPGKPIVITEHGYHSALNNRNSGFSPISSGDPLATCYIDENNVSQPFVSRTDGLVDHAVYMLRSFLEHRRVGVPHSFMYEFMNEKTFDNGNPAGATDVEKCGFVDQEQHFGLVSVYDGADGWRLRKLPAYFAMKRFLAWYRDDAAATVAPSSWPVRMNHSASVHSLVTSRSDGSVDVALWLIARIRSGSTYSPAAGDPKPGGGTYVNGDPEVENAKYRLAVLGASLYPSPETVLIEFGQQGTVCSPFQKMYPARDDTITPLASDTQLVIDVTVDPVLVRCTPTPIVTTTEAPTTTAAASTTPEVTTTSSVTPEPTTSTTPDATPTSTQPTTPADTGTTAEPTTPTTTTPEITPTSTDATTPANTQTTAAPTTTPAETTATLTSTDTTSNSPTSTTSAPATATTAAPITTSSPTTTAAAGVSNPKGTKKKPKLLWLWITLGVIGGVGLLAAVIAITVVLILKKRAATDLNAYILTDFSDAAGY